MKNGAFNVQHFQREDPCGVQTSELAKNDNILSLKFLTHQLIEIPMFDNSDGSMTKADITFDDHLSPAPEFVDLLDGSKDELEFVGKA